MVLVLMDTAHNGSLSVLNYYKSKKDGYQYKNASHNDFDYEKEILLEEDDDDVHAFDYEE